jgi:hypothetical protein
MRRDNSFEDRALGNGVYQGDLKYGRALGTEIKKQKDYKANYNPNGEAENKPIAPLTPAFKRDQTFWRGRNKHPKINANPPGLTDEILVKGMEVNRGLFANVSSFYSGGKRVF